MRAILHLCMLISSHTLLGASTSSVATGGAQRGYSPPTVDRHMATGFVQIRDFSLFLSGGGGSDSSPPDLLADGEGARCAASPPKKPTPASAVRARHRCAHCPPPQL